MTLYSEKEKIMWFSRRRKRNQFWGRKSKTPEANGELKETETADNSVSENQQESQRNAAEDNPSKTQAVAAEEKQSETKAAAAEEKQSETEAAAAEEKQSETQSAAAEEKQSETEAAAAEADQKEIEGSAAEDLSDRKTFPESKTPDLKEDEKEKAQRSLYDWHRAKKSKSSKQVKAVKKPVPLKNGMVLGEGLSKICVPITGKDRAAIEAQAGRIAAEKPDIVEWRADYFDDLCDEAKIAEVLMMLQDILGDIPVLFTIRTKREGGMGQMTAEKYRSLILFAAGRPEVSLIDIEGLNPEVNTELLISQVHELGMPVIASFHDFKKTPKKPELDLIFDRLERTGADVLKVAVMPKKPRDVLRLMSMTEEKNRSVSCPLVTMAMGDLGKISRVSGKITGSAMTFGSVGDASAPGQFPVGELRHLMEMI